MGAFLLWGVPGHMADLHREGRVFLALGGLFLAVAGIMKLRILWKNRNHGESTVSATSGSRRGMALILVLMLLALVSGSLFHGLILNRRALALADAGRRAAGLRLAAESAACRMVGGLAAGQLATNASVNIQVAEILIKGRTTVASSGAVVVPTWLGERLGPLSAYRGLDVVAGDGRGPCRVTAWVDTRAKERASVVLWLEGRTDPLRQ